MRHRSVCSVHIVSKAPHMAGVRQQAEARVPKLDEMRQSKQRGELPRSRRVCPEKPSNHGTGRLHGLLRLRRPPSGNLGKCEVPRLRESRLAQAPARTEHLPDPRLWYQKDALEQQLAACPPHRAVRPTTEVGARRRAVRRRKTRGARKGSRLVSNVALALRASCSPTLRLH